MILTIANGTSYTFKLKEKKPRINKTKVRMTYFSKKRKMNILSSLTLTSIKAEESSKDNSLQMLL